MAKASFIRSIRKMVVIVAFLGMMAVGYMTMSAATSCPAQAQVCTCGACVAIVPGASGAFANLAAQTGVQISAVTGVIIGQYTLAAEAFALQAVARFGQIVLDIDDWFDTFWFYNERPAMQASVEQENVMDAMQAATISAFRDAADINDINRLRGRLEVEAEREARPSAQLCSAATIAGGMMRANAIRRAYGRSAPVDAVRRTANTRGTAAARGKGGDMQERWNNVRVSYCKASENNGQSGCTQDGTMVNADIDVTGRVFMQDTIDLTDPSTRAAVNDLIDNVAEPFVPNLRPVSQTNTAAGISATQARDEYTAQRQAIHTALQHVVARRAPGGANGEFLSALRGSVGLTADMFSSNPSHNEIMEVMNSERFRTGEYSVQQVDTPENNARELVVQEAFQVMQMKDQLDITDMMSLMLAVEMGLEAREARPNGGAR